MNNTIAVLPLLLTTFFGCNIPSFFSKNTQSIESWYNEGIGVGYAACCSVTWQSHVLPDLNIHEPSVPATPIADTPTAITPACECKSCECRPCRCTQDTKAPRKTKRQASYRPSHTKTVWTPVKYVQPCADGTCPVPTDGAPSSCSSGNVELSHTNHGNIGGVGIVVNKESGKVFDPQAPFFERGPVRRLLKRTAQGWNRLAPVRRILRIGRFRCCR